MRKLLTFLFACIAAVAIQAQVMKCHIDGPANVRQHPNTKSAVMGSIKNSQGSQQVNYDQVILNELQSIQNEIFSLTT